MQYASRTFTFQDVRFSSFPRMRESSQPPNNWIPAFAGMTKIY